MSSKSQKIYSKKEIFVYYTAYSIQPYWNVKLISSFGFCCAQWRRKWVDENI